jgi:RNA polymerase sigma-70 factor (ECF subfamily)
MNFSPVAGNLLCEARMAVTSEQLYEQTLVLRSQIGDESAFAELLIRYGPRLLLFTQRMMQSSPEQVADLAQEIWVAIFRALPGLRDASKFRAWAFRIARDRIYREYRRRKLSVQPLEETNLEERQETDEHTTAADLEELRHCLGAISPEHREALVLRFFEEMSYEEIARVTGATVGTVRSRIHYGKRALRTVWEGKLL